MDRGSPGRDRHPHPGTPRWPGGAAVPDRSRHPARPVTVIPHDGHPHRGVHRLGQRAHCPARPGRHHPRRPARPYRHFPVPQRPWPGISPRRAAWSPSRSSTGICGRWSARATARASATASTSSWTWKPPERLPNTSARSTTPCTMAEVVSGPAARRLIHAAREEHHRFGGILTTPRQAKALLSDPALTVFENADAYLICNYDPCRALCNPDNAAGGLASTPSLDRCQPTCPNIARTDSHARQTRTLAERLRERSGCGADPAAGRRPAAPPRHRAGRACRQARPHPHRTHRRGRTSIPPTVNAAGIERRDRPAARRHAPASPSDGALTVVSLAVEADTSNTRARRPHTDLKDEFYARVRAQGHVPASSSNSRDRAEDHQAEAGRGPRGKSAAKRICRGVRPIVPNIPHRRERPADPAAKRAGQQDPDSAPARHQLKNECQQQQSSCRTSRRRGHQLSLTRAPDSAWQCRSSTTASDLMAYEVDPFRVAKIQVRRRDASPEVCRQYSLTRTIVSYVLDPLGARSTSPG